jgi:hypothetical protein
MANPPTGGDAKPPVCGIQRDQQIAGLPAGAALSRTVVILDIDLSQGSRIRHSKLR